MQQKNKKIDGHAAGINGDDLNVYLAAGIRTDHEATTAEEARERLALGMYLMIREGTVAKDLHALYQQSLLKIHVAAYLSLMIN